MHMVFFYDVLLCCETWDGKRWQAVHGRSEGCLDVHSPNNREPCKCHCHNEEDCLHVHVR